MAFITPFLCIKGQKMKKLQLTISHIVGVAVATACLLFASGVSAKDFHVDLRIESSPAELVASSRGSCRNYNHPGCVQTDKYQSADINFNLKGDKKCDLADGADWSLTGVYLGGKGSLSKPDAMGNLDSEVEADFDVANATSGLLNYQNGSNPQHIRITNRNSNSYSIWYTFVASCTDRDGNVLGTLRLDPRVKNTGGNE